MVAGEVSQPCLISLEGSCVAKTQQLPSSWLRVWEPARKAKMHINTLQAYAGLCLYFTLSFVLLHKNTAKSHQTALCFFTFTPLLNFNLWFSSRPSSSIMWFRIPTLQRTACGVGCMFRFLQISVVRFPLYCDRLNQSNVNKLS